MTPVNTPSDIGIIGNISMTDAAGAGAQQGSKFKMNDHYQKVALGILLMFVCAISWTSASQFALDTYVWPDFYAPFALVYLSTSTMIVFYPLYIIGYAICLRGKISLKETFLENVAVYGEEVIGVRLRKIVGKCALFCLLWMVANYVYVRALHMKAAFDVVVLFATHSSFVYLLSWIILQKQFMAIRIVAIILAITGICILTYMHGGFASDGMWGSVLAVTSTAVAALFKVLQKKMFGEVTVGQLSLFLSCLAIFNCISMLPILVVLTLTDAEPIVWDRIPWTQVGAVTGSVFVLVCSMQYGTRCAYPHFLQLCFVVSIPICAAVDLVWRQVNIEGMQIAASILIVISAFLNILPDDWQKVLLSRLQCQRRAKRDNTQDAVMSPRQRLRSTAC